MARPIRARARPIPTQLYSHRACLGHDTGFGPGEAPDRLPAILGEAVRLAPVRRGGRLVSGLEGGYYLRVPARRAALHARALLDPCAPYPRLG